MTDTITLPRATVQQALDALEWSTPFQDATVTHSDAITALRAALEQQQAEPVQKPKYMAQSNGRHSPLLTHMMNKRTALAEPEQSFEDEQRVINADNHRRANALEEAIHAAWSAGYVEGEKAVLEQQTEPVQETEAFGFVTVRRLSQRFENHHDQYQFYPAGQIPYLDNVDECHTVYTAPPQRKPLTDEQLDDIAVVARRGNLHDLRIAIEAKLKEANNAA